MWYTNLFGRILNMSMTACVVILIVLAARLILLKAPKKFSYVLWAAVLFRLLCPVSIPSPVSLLEWFAPPATESGTIDYVTFEPDYEALRTPVFETVFADDAVTQSIPVPVLELIWGSGILVMLLYGVYAVLRTRHMTVGAVNLRENVYLSDYVPTAFVSGVVRPRIYLPSALSEGEREAVILHERTHIRRRDHITRGLAYLALCLHWFNPLVWTAFFVSGTDMELSCDEAVLRKLGREVRTDYSQSILNLAVGRKSIADPLSFGGGNLKRRITNVLNYRKPAVWITAAAVILAAALAAVLICNPAEKEQDKHIGGVKREWVESILEEYLPEGTAFEIQSFFCREVEPQWPWQKSFYYALETFTTTENAIGYVFFGKESIDDPYELLGVELFENAFAEGNKIYYADVPLVMSMDGKAARRNTHEVVFIDNREYAAEHPLKMITPFSVANYRVKAENGRILWAGATSGDFIICILSPAMLAGSEEIEIHYTDADGNYLAPVYTFTID